MNPAVIGLIALGTCVVLGALAILAWCRAQRLARLSMSWSEALRAKDLEARVGIRRTIDLEHARDGLRFEPLRSTVTAETARARSAQEAVLTVERELQATRQAALLQAEELARLREQIAPPTDLWLALLGPPGAGKSALLNSFLLNAEEGLRTGASDGVAVVASARKFQHMGRSRRRVFPVQISGALDAGGEFCSELTSAFSTLRSRGARNLIIILAAGLPEAGKEAQFEQAKGYFTALRAIQPALAGFERLALASLLLKSDLRSDASLEKWTREMDQLRERWTVFHRHPRTLALSFIKTRAQASCADLESAIGGVVEAWGGESR